MIQESLVQISKELYQKTGSQIVHFLEDRNENLFLNDLTNFPHAFVLGCLMDREIKVERAWIIPERIRNILGTFKFRELQRVSLNEYRRIFKKEKLHRFNDKMAEVFHVGVQRIHELYSGKADKIWSGKPTSSTVVDRFLGFKGSSLKIATMATNILARQFKIPFSDYYSVDISPDMHIRRAMTRMGLVPTGASNAQIIYKAREISPEFPGITDFTCWEIGQHWCKPKKPNCAHCLVNSECPKVI